MLGRSPEDGAVAMYVVVLLVVLVGMAAFIVDIGDGLWERRMLQNSADAAALAVAVDCAEGDCSTFEATADSFADANNRRGAFVERVTGPTGGDPTFQDGSVTVVARTGSTAESGRLPQIFSGILGQTQGLETGARATAEWQVVGGGAATLPLTISICDYFTGTNMGQNVNPGPEVYIGFKDSGLAGGGNDNPGQGGDNPGQGGGNSGQGGGNSGQDGDDEPGDGGSDDVSEIINQCVLDPADLEGYQADRWPGGLDFPGGFGWLDLSTDPDDGCLARVAAGSVGGSVGNPGFPTGGGSGGSNSNVCDQAYYQSLLGKTVLLPVHVDVSGGGENAVYEVVGFAGFELTGYKLGSGNNLKSDPGFSCPFGPGGQATCIRGFFRNFVDSTATPDETAVDFLTRTIRLTE